MNFKDILENDLNIFLNTSEFAGIHKINGVSFSITVDHEKLKERHTKDFDGLIVGDILYFVKVKDILLKFLKPPKIGDAQMFDKKPCEIVDIKEDEGIFEIILAYNSR